MAARQPLLAIIMAVSLLTGGCRNTSPPTTVSSSAPSASDKAPPAHRARTETQQEQEPDPQTQAIDALTRRTASHAQDIEELLSRRGAEGPAAESDVLWMEPDSHTLLVDSAINDVPRANPSGPVEVSPAHSFATSHDRQMPSADAPKAAVNPFDGPQILPPEADHDLPLSSDRAHTDLLHERLTRHIRDYPRDTAGHLEYQLLQFLRGEQVPQLSAIASLPVEDRELLVALLDGLSNFRSTLRADNNMLLSRKVRPLIQMSDRLRTQADLHIPTIALCTRVDGFGVYQPIEPARFTAGQEHPAIIYCEVQNFSSQMNDDRKWETHLAHEAVLYTEGGMNVWQEPVHMVTDQSRNRRQDFFVVKLVRLPASLTIGQYVLKVTIRDEHAGRVAEASLPIQIVSR
jgi:hypothetical protein